MIVWANTKCVAYRQHYCVRQGKSMSTFSSSVYFASERFCRGPVDKGLPPRHICLLQTTLELRWGGGKSPFLLTCFVIWFAVTLGMAACEVWIINGHLALHLVTPLNYT